MFNIFSSVLFNKVILVSEILGLAGAFLVVIAWIFEVQQIVRARHSPLDWNFGILYLSGAVLLTAYALLINSPVFALLNLLAALMALFGLYYKWNEKRAAGSSVRKQKRGGRRK
ncbi:MAG TPA: hypothetical protein VI875_00275 [Candidatus Norongarragalinales archaeon]|nr:hypothetical protein [Candidatus Norongarragalinales archaeon]